MKQKWTLQYVVKIHDCARLIKYMYQICVMIKWREEPVWPSILPNAWQNKLKTVERALWG